MSNKDNALVEKGNSMLHLVERYTN